MNGTLTATVIPTVDIRLNADATTKEQNVALLREIHGHRTKASGVLTILGGEPGSVHIKFHEKNKSPQHVRIATTGTQSFEGEDGLLETDHVMSRTVGGNARNEVGHLESFVHAGLRQQPSTVFSSRFERKILNVYTDTGIRSVGAAFPDDLSEFAQFREQISNGTVNISDHTISHVLGEPLGEGHTPLLNPTSSKWAENGEISSKMGRAPGIAAGIAEMPLFLRGAIPPERTLVTTDEYIIHDSIVNDEIPVFQRGILNHVIARALNVYGWQYNSLLYNIPKRKQQLPCDLVMNQGSSGGAVRVGNLWAFSSTPGYEPSRRLGNIITLDQKLPFSGINEPLTDFHTITDTSGCGDVVAALQAHFNTERAQIRKCVAQASVGEQVVTNERILDVAEVLYISLLMRMYALLVFHTRGTSLSHLARPRGILSGIHSDAAKQAIEIAKHVDMNRLHPHDPIPIHSAQFDIDIALWIQDEAIRWPQSPRPRPMRGVVQPLDFEGEYHEPSEGPNNSSLL